MFLLIIHQKKSLQAIGLHALFAIMHGKGDALEVIHLHESCDILIKVGYYTQCLLEDYLPLQTKIVHRILYA